MGGPGGRDRTGTERSGTTAATPDASGRALSWTYCEEFVPEDEHQLRARELALELDRPTILPGAGSVLRLLAAALQARSVVEIGTGTGIGALWLLGGMPDDGVLTTIDPEVALQRAAKQILTGAGVRPSRLRAIAGRPADVLPRLADGAYDLVLVAGDVHGYPLAVEEGLRLLRPGGVLAVDAALARDKVANPARRDELTTLVRDVGRTVRDDDRLLPALLPSGDGLLLGVRR
ncbi:O-methyltransferase [Luteimicrobium sp. NPDC057192]|uniref:O-methyltransferase n=1 Tax=Luteimicrobium sp. NPDC057192 TaxID=3346042 RepID=UPI003645D3D8